MGIPEEKQHKYHDRGGAFSERGGCTMAFTLVQKEETLALASSPWHLTAFVSKFIKTEMESVGRATARRWFSYTHRKRQTEQKQKKTIAGEETDRHKEPGRIFSGGKRLAKQSGCLHAYFVVIMKVLFIYLCITFIQQ